MNIFQNRHTFINLALKEALTPLVSGQCPLDRVPFSGCGLLVNKNFVKYEIDSDSRKSFHFDIVVQIIPFSCRQKLLSRKCKDEKKSNGKKDKKKKKEEKNKGSKAEKGEAKKTDKG